MKQFLLLSAFLFITVFYVSAQWSSDTAVRNPVCTAANYQYEPLMCTDGHKGVIIVWADQRTSPQQIFVQRVDSSGVNKWAANGIQLPQSSGNLGPDAPLIISDGAGGAIIFYTVTIDGGADNIYAQRVDGNGNFLWTPAGVAVATAQDSRIRSNESIVNNNAGSDGMGGAFVTFQTYSPFNNYVQYVDKNGNLPWGSTGVQLTSNDSTGTRYESFVIGTGGGTAVAGYSYDTRLYLQRVSASGNKMWGTGLLVADSFIINESSNQGAFFVFDSLSATKNIMLTWLDVRKQDSQGNHVQLYSQKVDLNGNIIWQPKGIPVTTYAFNASNPDMVIDKTGGFFIIYDSIYNDVVQHISNTGQPLWAPGGIAVAAPYYTINPVLGYDGSGGIIAMWYDGRTGPNYNQAALFAQRYTLQGTPLWRTNGIPVISQNVSENHSTNSIISLEDGTAIACWATGGGDIYAAKFGGASGLLPVNLISFTAQPQKNTVQLQWVTAQEINSSYFGVEHASAGLQFTQFATVQAAGDASTQQTYTSVDDNPVAGVNYYRLKMVNKDGSFTYSAVIPVTIGSFTGIAAYPNPAVNSITVKINAQTQQTTLCVYDAIGKLIMQKQVILNNGENTTELNVEGLAPGLYYIEAAKTGMKVKFIKQ